MYGFNIYWMLDFQLTFSQHRKRMWISLNTDISASFLISIICIKVHVYIYISMSVQYNGFMEKLKHVAHFGR